MPGRSIRYAPPSGWANDPNGLVWRDGAWHLYHQYAENPPAWRPIHWGHARSPDLVRWTWRGVALVGTDAGQAYSGSVLDAAEGLLAYHTRHRTNGDGTVRQTQDLAIGPPDGPFLQSPAPLIDTGRRDQRDPFVFRHGTGWFMVLAEPANWSEWQGVCSRIRLYGSESGRAWTDLGGIGPQAAEGVLVEVPLLAPIPVLGGGTRWTLLWSEVDRRADANTCRVMWQSGTFDGRAFAPDAPPQPLDHGPDLYALTLSTTPPDARGALGIGWLSSWAYARTLPPLPCAGGPMTLPRRLVLVRGGGGAPHLMARPSRAVAALRRARVPWHPGSQDIPLPSDAVELRCRVSGEAWRLALQAGDGRDRLVLEGSRERVRISRWGPPDGPTGFSGAWDVPLPPRRAHTLQLWADQAGVELVLDGGRAAFTARLWPEPAIAAMSVEGATGGLHLWTLGDATVMPPT